jgi:hypothetical protein
MCPRRRRGKFKLHALLFETANNIYPSLEAKLPVTPTIPLLDRHCAPSTRHLPSRIIEPAFHIGQTMKPAVRP